jgi:drug/metabolite transporter (DMT)-like permease
MLLFVAANKLTASANAILLQYTAPVWAALLAWFFLKEKPRWESWGAIALVSLGMLLVFSDGIAAGSLLGDIFALLSGIAFGANSVALRSRKDGNTMDIMFFSHALCVLFSLPFFFLYPPVIQPHNFASIAFMGILQVGAASALFAFGIKRVPAVQAMLTAAIEPVLNPIWVLLALGETPGITVLAGGGIILGAVLFSSIISTLRRRN